MLHLEQKRYCVIPVKITYMCSRHKTLLGNGMIWSLLRIIEFWWPENLEFRNFVRKIVR